jgi:DNA-binding CsgD family transcriptional regulator
MEKRRVDLTKQERTIIALLARGQTANRIAATIDATPRSVERQILTCRHKLDARNNAELVAKAVSSGLCSV